MEAVLEVPEHEHPLKLFDLQLQYPHYEEEEEEEKEEKDPIMKEGFEGVTCQRCREEIHMYHRYYYTCSSSCDDFSLHKFCGELPSWLVHPSHPPHTLHLEPYSDLYLERICKICMRHHKPGEYHYNCHECRFSIDVKCALEVGKNIIYHPSHPHLLICAIPKPILCHCNACGKEHKGIFYQCSTTCGGFTIHTECAFLPQKLLIQQRTHGSFYHTHPLTISYSFPLKDQQAKHFPRCRVCGGDFYGKDDLWIYKCDKCLYYAHVDCVRVPPPTAGFGKTAKNYEDVDHPGLLHLPFPDETYSLPKHYLFFQQSGTSNHKVDDHLIHMSHQHPLILVDHTHSNEQTSSSLNSLLLIKCHDPMKKTRLLCNGCLRPIMSTMPFYICDHHSCNDFALHEWCTRLPSELQNHPGHPHHTLHLIYSNIPGCFFDVFLCNVCCLPCNGFAYGCVGCEYYVDVTCGLIPKQITHEAHPNHLLSIDKSVALFFCQICLESDQRREWSFRCNICYIFMHPECALLLAKTIRHKCDKHPMHLSYHPIENHKSEYFCEICEEDLNPHVSFYHCQDCAQSVHTACAQSILQNETHTYIEYRRATHYFVNIKFGGIHKTHSHPHPLSFSQGIVLDGECSNCHRRLQYKMIFKCLKCKFAIDYGCCKKYYI
ncbi:hypothetical protein Lser_V15G38642 [Lactuca serriola]